jgi:lysophospholipase L1-like esterase
MKYIYIVSVTIVLAMIGYYVLHSKPITNYPSRGTDIVAFGDSLVQGVGSTNGNDFVSVLSKKIGKPIINLGVSGNTTADGVKRLGELDRYKPRVVIVLLGGNDYLKRVPRKETLNNLQTIITSIHSKGSIVLLLGVRGGILVDNFKEVFEDMSKLNRTAFVPNVLEGLLGEKELMSDAIHPNDKGYLIISERVYKVLKDII